MRARTIIALVIGLAWAGNPVQAGDKTIRRELPEGITIACPATWPEGKGGKAKLRTTNVFGNFLDVLLPALEDPEFTTEGSGDIQMDCIYENGGHLTLIVPGFPITCYHRPPPEGGLTDWPGFCDTRPGSDGKLGPVRQIPAEPLTLETTIQGFGLRWSLERVLKAAAANGYKAETTAEETVERRTVLRLQATRPGDEVIILFSRATGLSQEIVWPGPPPTASREARFDSSRALARRFGLTFTYADRRAGESSVRRRKGHGNPLILDMAEKHGVILGEWQNFVHLIDGEADGQAPSR